jgi:hypothetical protein
MLFDVEQSYLLFQHPPSLSDFPHDIHSHRMRASGGCDLRQAPQILVKI